MNTTEIVAVITGVSTLLAATGGIWLKVVFDHRESRQQERLASYERLSNATRVLALRAVVYKDRGSVPSVLGESVLSSSNLLLTLFFVAVPRIRGGLGIPGITALSRSLPAPQMDSPAATLGTVIEALEEVISASSAVQLRGSLEALEATDGLLRASSDFVDFVLRQAAVRKWRKMPPQYDKYLSDINVARQHFLDVVRVESN